MILKNGRVFESDVPIEARTLVDMYTDSEEPSVGHREVFFDIECEVTDGFPETHKEARTRLQKSSSMIKQWIPIIVMYWVMFQIQMS